jgi:tripartite-type tricarboxylate transporter receptor subunit TctC
MRFLSHNITKFLLLILISFISLPSISNAAYPDKPITLIVPWAAGGGTDATARAVATGLEKELGQPVHVLNKTGASGVIGHLAIAEAAPDGYTIGMITVELNMMHWQGLTEMDYKSFTPLALINTDPAGLQVRSDAPYKSIAELIDTIKTSPGKLKASGSGQGGIWHLALAGMLQAQKLDLNAVQWIPNNGSAPAYEQLGTGSLDIVCSSMPEGYAMITSGKVKSLVVMGPERIAAYPDTPTLKESTGLDWQTMTWRGIAGPKGLPADRIIKLEKALQNVYGSKEFKGFMSQRGYGMEWADSQGFYNMMAKRDEALGKILSAVGMTK